MKVRTSTSLEQASKPGFYQIAQSKFCGELANSSDLARGFETRGKKGVAVL
jgi:hypothetical protein